jgi:hypothetical protein
MFLLFKHGKHVLRWGTPGSPEKHQDDLFRVQDFFLEVGFCDAWDGHCCVCGGGFEVLVGKYCLEGLEVREEETEDGTS